VGQESVARYGAPFFMYHRADLHTALVDALRAVTPDAVTLNATVTGFDQDGDRVTLKLADGDAITGHALVGADGVHSAVRRALFGPDDPQFTGIMVWRGLIPADRLPPDRIRQLGTNWMGPGAHVVHYFLRRGEILNFVGAKERDDWQVESWSTRGSHEECLADFAGWHDDILTMIKLIDVPYKWALMMRPAMAAWSAGRATLLGDACHPTLPFMAQGACMAIEDGLVLARCVEAFDDIEEALRHYEAARLDRTSRIVEGANDNAKRFHNPALATREGAIDYLSTQFDPSRISDRYDWVFEYDAATVEI
jgi:salicylate hydroxylase